MSRAQLLEALPGWQWGAGADPWLETYQCEKPWRNRLGNADPRCKIKIGGRVRKKSELNADDAEEVTLGKWISTQRCSRDGGKARLSGWHEQVCTAA